MKGDGGGLNARFLGPEASLNSCHCRSVFTAASLCLSLFLSTGMENQTLLRCLSATEIKAQTPKNVKPVVPC